MEKIQDFQPCGLRSLKTVASGIAFGMNEPMRRVAAEKNYTAETFAQLTAAIVQTLKAGTREEASSK